MSETKNRCKTASTIVIVLAVLVIIASTIAIIFSCTSLLNNPYSLTRSYQDITLSMPPFSFFMPLFMAVMLFAAGAMNRAALSGKVVIRSNSLLVTDETAYFKVANRMTIIFITICTVFLVTYFLLFFDVRHSDILSTILVALDTITLILSIYMITLSKRVMQESKLQIEGSSITHM